MSSNTQYSSYSSKKNLSTTSTLVNSQKSSGYTLGMEKPTPKPAPKPSACPVKQVGIECYKEVALSLAEAFREDELAFYFMNTEDNWRSKQEVWDLHVEILEYIVAAHCYNGLVYTIGEKHEGVALWMPPGCNMDDYYTVFRSGMWRLWYKLTPEGRKRYFDEFFTVLHDTKAEVLGERDANSWYLVYLGVHPSAQKQGLARKLIEHILKRADKEGLPTYLESSNIVNVPIYEKFGFQVKKHITLDRAEKPVPLDIMVREPRQYPATPVAPPKASTPAPAPASTRPRKNSVAQTMLLRHGHSLASSIRPMRLGDKA